MLMRACGEVLSAHKMWATAGARLHAKNVVCAELPCIRRFYADLNGRHCADGILRAVGVLGC